MSLYRLAYLYTDEDIVAPSVAQMWRQRAKLRQKKKQEQQDAAASPTGRLHSNDGGGSRRTGLLFVTNSNHVALSSLPVYQGCRGGLFFVNGNGKKRYINHDDSHLWLDTSEILFRDEDEDSVR